MKIVVLGKPLGQPRQRVGVRAGHAVNYLPSEHPIHGFKADIRAAWRSTGLAPFTGAVACVIEAVFPRPKSKTKKRGDNPRLPHTGKPDADNIAKSVLDALNGVAFKDDSQVVSLTVLKMIGEPDESPRVEVKLHEPEYWK
jgi:Holliday junction resolvase RusA-like endonuclease